MSHFPWPHILMFYLAQPYTQKITFPSRHCLSKDHDPFPCPFPGLCVLWERVCICSQQQQRGGSLLKRFGLPRCWCLLQSQSSYVFLYGEERNRKLSPSNLGCDEFILGIACFSVLTVPEVWANCLRQDTWFACLN